MAYATPEDFMVRYDTRRLGDLVQDDGGRSTEAGLDSDGNLQAMLDDSSGLVNSAALMGGRYTTGDLAGLEGDDASFLKRIVCDLAFGFLNERRGYPDEQAPGFARALALLERLRQGTAIFAVQSAIDASKPQRVVLDAKKTLVAAAGRYFGRLALDGSEPQPKGF